jgi:hypothetical protein
VSVAQEMLRTSPSQPGYSPEPLAACIDACLECGQACTACADACLGEEMVAELRRCITVDLGCADLCEATAAILSRQTSYDAALSRAALEACREACRICAEECERHAERHEHCRICAEACRRCEEACAALLAG